MDGKSLAMKNLFLKYYSVFVLLLLASCDNSESSISQPVTPSDGLGASSTTLVLLTGSDGHTVISGGTEPYSIMENSNSSVANAQMSVRELQVTAVSIGSTTIKVKDSSSPAKTVTVTVTVKNSYSSGTAGAVSFTSNRGNYSVNGVGEFGIYPPVSGAGALAVQDFESLMIFAYKVNSTTNLDIVLMGFESNTSDYSGTFYYPASGKIVYVSYFPGANPADSTFLQSGFLLNGSSTATMESITSSSMKGTFSGNGYYFSNGASNTSIGINLTNGSFNVPIIRTGLMADRSVQKNVARMVEMIRARSAEL
jgi:hypothetical protein